jgi:FkbM family methyltransferase
MTLRETMSLFRAGEIDKTTYVQRMHELHVRLIEYSHFLKSTAISRIEIEDGRTVFTCRENGVRMLYVDEEDCHTTPLTLLNFGAYEPEESTLFFRIAQTLAKRGPLTFLDIGANVGWYSLNVARRIPEAHIHAFEPVPRVFEILKGNLELNACAHATAHNIGLLESSGEHNFYYEPDISGRTSATDLSMEGRATVLQRPVSTLDEIAAQQDLKPSLIKCDVEGAELNVFRGGLKTLERHSPVVFTEMLRKWAARFGYHPNEIIELFRGLGYGCHRVHSGRLEPLERMEEDTPETNFFFLHREAHRFLLEAKG